LQTANSELSEQQKKLTEEVTSLQSRLYSSYLYAICMLLSCGVFLVFMTIIGIY